MPFVPVRAAPSQIHISFKYQFCPPRRPGLPPAPCKISIDEPMLFKVVNTYTRETRTSAKMTDTVIADGRGAFARVVEPIPPQHQVKHPKV